MSIDVPQYIRSERSDQFATLLNLSSDTSRHFSYNREWRTQINSPGLGVGKFFPASSFEVKKVGETAPIIGEWNPVSTKTSTTYRDYSVSSSMGFVATSLDPSVLVANGRGSGTPTMEVLTYNNTNASPSIYGPQQLSQITTMSSYYFTGRVEMSWFVATNFGSSAISGRSALAGAVSAQDHEGKAVPILEAAKRMGFDHFNWIQTIKESSILEDKTFRSLTTGLRVKAGPGTLDPYPGGWLCDDCGGIDLEGSDPDKYPFYKDEGEKAIPGRELNWVGKTLSTKVDLRELAATDDGYRSLVSGATRETGLSQIFFDAPQSPIAGYNTFFTQLVGVREDGTFEPIEGEGTSIVWTWLTDGTESSIYSFEGNSQPGGTFQLFQPRSATVVEFFSALGVSSEEELAALGGNGFVSAVPEPRSWPLMLCGLGLMAALWNLMRYRKLKVQ